MSIDREAEIPGLLRELCRNRDEGAYPLHMPGHKRNTEKYRMDNPYGLDITEIDGFDDLHEPEGILAEGMQRAARVCGADESWYLVNGSTAGILAGIAACTRRGDRILMARGCHKSAYNAAMIGGLRPVYLYPPASGSWNISGSIRPEDVEKALASDESEGTVPRGRIALVVVTSPTYEGVISDIRGIAAACHAHGVPLLVDEAHGAHLVLPGFPESAVSCGADLVIQSLHKTLPAFTQTGLLHRCGNLVSGGRVKQFLDIYQSSSPSYLLMAGIDQCVGWMEQESTPVDAAVWQGMLREFYEMTSGCRSLRVLGREPEFFDRDPSKLVISTRNTGHTGPELMSILREEYGFELEMASADYVIAMTGAGDRPEEIRRFARAICDLDRRWSGEFPETGAEDVEVSWNNWRAAAVMDLAEADDLKNGAGGDPGKMPEEIPLDEKALGRISLDFVYAYPPGIPLLAPGERVTEEVLRMADTLRAAGVRLRFPSSRNEMLHCVNDFAE